MSDPDRLPAAHIRASVKLVASVLVVVAAVGGILFASTRAGGEYYKHVDEVMSHIDAFRGKRLQVHGHVVKNSIEQAKGTLRYRFKIENRAPRPAAVVVACRVPTPGPSAILHRAQFDRHDPCPGAVTPCWVVSLLLA